MSIYVAEEWQEALPAHGCLQLEVFTSTHCTF